MKSKIAIPIVTLLSVTSCATTTTTPNSLRYITYSDSTVKLSIAEQEVQSVKLTTTVYYFYAKNAIHRNEGAISGYPLHGDYLVYNSSNNLICKGQFKKGVKVGEWMRWNSNGNLTSIIKYSNGRLDKILYPKPVKIKKQKASAKSAADTTKHRWYQFYRKGTRSKASQMIPVDHPSSKVS